MEENEYYNEEVNSYDHDENLSDENDGEYADDQDELQETKTKSDTFAELRRKEQGLKYEMTKIDYTSHLKKTEKPQPSVGEKKSSSDSPNYKNQLRTTDAGVAIQPEYVRLAKQGDSDRKPVEKKYTADELINMAFKRADDADQRDPAVRRGVTQKPTVTLGTFQGIKDSTKEDYKSALKQHVTVEPKSPQKAPDEKPSWASGGPRRVNQSDIISRGKDTKQDKPEWAQFGRGAKKHISELEQTKHAEKTQAPEWANLANKTDRKRLIQLEQRKSTGKSDSGQPEWASKSRDAREVLKAEIKGSRRAGDSDAPDYKAVLRNGNRKE